MLDFIIIINTVLADEIVLPKSEPIPFELKMTIGIIVVSIVLIAILVIRIIKKKKVIIKI